MKRAILNTYQDRFCQVWTTYTGCRDFVLSGGTALAEAYLHHRLSDDLDFFCPDNFDSKTIEQRLGEQKSLLGITTITKQKLYDRNIFECRYYDNHLLKCEFTRYPKSLYKPILYKSLRIDSKQDCIINKIMCLYDRTDPKDFVDLYICCKDYTHLERINYLHLVEKKFGVRITEGSFALACKKIDTIQQLPRMLVPCSIINLQTYFHSLAYQLGSHILI